MQKNAVDTSFEILNYIKQKGDDALLETSRKMTSSDHLYYMSTKYFLFAAADIYEQLNMSKADGVNNAF